MRIRLTTAVATLALLAVSARADIYQWVDNSPSFPPHVQGTTLCPDGAGVTAGPGVDLRGLDLTKAYLTSKDLTGANLSATILASAELMQASLIGVTAPQVSLAGAFLEQANFTNAKIDGIMIGWTTGFTAAQLYATASYQARDLRGIAWKSITGSVNLAGQNLSNGYFGDRNMDNEDLTGADMRGCQSTDLASANVITTNLIRPDGTIQGLNLTGSKALVVRDYDGDPENSIGLLPITVQTSMTMDATSTLEMVFEADAWDSTISFAAGIPVALGGTLELGFASGVDLPSQIGRAFRLFNWAGVSPPGSFSVGGAFNWDLDDLYSGGTVTLLGMLLAGDCNGDGLVNALDISSFITALTSGVFNNAADVNDDGVVNGLDIAPFISVLTGGGSAAVVPEPASLVCLLVVGALRRSRRV